MNTDMVSLIHYGITVATSFATIVLAYLKLKDKQTGRDHEDHQICMEEFSNLAEDVQKLKTETAVMTERVGNLIHTLEKLDDKLTKWEQQ